MQTSSATERLFKRDGSFYLTKVFGIDDMPFFSVTPSDNVHLITNKFVLAEKTSTVKIKGQILYIRTKNFKAVEFRHRLIYSSDQPA